MIIPDNIKPIDVCWQLYAKARMVYGSEEFCNLHWELSSDIINEYIAYNFPDCYIVNRDEYNTMFGIPVKIEYDQTKSVKLCKDITEDLMGLPVREESDGWL